MSKPFSEACENNKAPILSVISHYYTSGISVLEIGSMTAQHIQYFAEKLPEITWQPSEIAENMKTLRAGLEGVERDNILSPLQLDVNDTIWPLTMVEGIFSANTLHIMSEAHVARFFRGASVVMAPESCLCVYGPFNYGGEYTSESNARFDNWLKIENPASGIRDFEKVNALATKESMSLVGDHEMPANNRLLVWQKMINYFPV